MPGIRQRLILCLALAAALRASASDFTQDALIDAIRERDLRTVEAVLAILPAPMLEQYTLAFASRSLQGATPAAPRAILFGGDARFIVTFNGGADERGFETLETLQFDERSNSFHFRELTFSSIGEGVTVSEDNPARCAACHGRPARPIWDSPPTWPGIYGERYGAGLSRTESAGMAAFLAHQAGDVRYRLLRAATRFAERETYVANSQVLYGGSGFEAPNARLSKLLASLNARAIAAELVGAPAFAPHRYALLAAAGSDCGSVASFFPASLRAALTGGLAAYQRSAVNAQANQSAAKRFRRASATDAYQAGIAAADPITLRFMAERLVGLPHERWSLALEADAADVASPEGSLTLDRILFERLADSEPELRDLRSFRSYTPTDPYCAEIRRRSERELNAFYGPTGGRLLLAAATPAAREQSAQPPLLEHCIACHTGEVGPALPFGEPAVLGARLTTGSYPHGRLLDEILYRLSPVAGTGRMPRDIYAAPQEQEELENYFLQLAAR